MPRTYLDYDLLIERVGEEPAEGSDAFQRYRARVLDSPGGQASVDFTLPFAPYEMDNILLRITKSLGEARRNLRRLETPERQLVRSFGSRLFQAVFTGGVQDTLQGSMAEANRRNVGLRVRLRLTEAPKLADVPWEFLHNPVANQFLSLNPDTPLVRYLDLPQAGRALTVTPPLQVLVMISSPSDFPKLDVEAEWARLNSSLHDLIEREVVTLTRLPNASLASLQRPLRLSHYHIFHFVGHGGFDDQAQDGALVFEDEQGRGRLVSGQDLAVMLTGHRSLRLVILNACEGARSSPSDPFAGVAQTLIQQAIPAVVAMQFEITDEAAIVFAREFYGAVADGYPVDAAVAESRRAIFAQGNDVEWGTPVLHMRSPNGLLFRLGTGSAAVREQEEREEREEREKRERLEREEEERLERERLEKDERQRAEKKERERLEWERLERERLEREEQERLDREQQERARAEKERIEEQEHLEQERREQERLDRERLAREEEERKRRIRTDPFTGAYVVAFLGLDAVLLLGTFADWGPRGVRSAHNAWERAALLIVTSNVERNPDLHWIASLGLVLFVLALGIAAAAVARRPAVLAVLGATSAASSLTAAWHFFARAKNDPDNFDWVETATLGTLGWGMWLVVATGVAILVLGLVVLVRRRRATQAVTPA